jgi:hypothetical protein
VDEVLLELDCKIELAPDDVRDVDKLLRLLADRVTLKLAVVGKRR